MSHLLAGVYHDEFDSEFRSSFLWYEPIKINLASIRGRFVYRAVTLEQAGSFLSFFFEDASEKVEAFDPEKKKKKRSGFPRKQPSVRPRCWTCTVTPASVLFAWKGASLSQHRVLGIVKMLLTMSGQVLKTSSTLLLRRALFLTPVTFCRLLPSAWKLPLATADFSSPDSLNKHVGSLGCVSESSNSRPLRLQSYDSPRYVYVWLCFIVVCFFFFCISFRLHNDSMPDYNMRGSEKKQQAKSAPWSDMYWLGRFIFPAFSCAVIKGSGALTATPITRG